MEHEKNLALEREQEIAQVMLNIAVRAAGLRLWTLVSKISLSSHLQIWRRCADGAAASLSGTNVPCVHMLLSRCSPLVHSAPSRLGSFRSLLPFLVEQQIALSVLLFIFVAALDARYNHHPPRATDRRMSAFNVTSLTFNNQPLGILRCDRWCRKCSRKNRRAGTCVAGADDPSGSVAGGSPGGG